MSAGKEKKQIHLKHWQVIAIYLVIYDILVVNASYFMALWLRFDVHFSMIPKYYLNSWKSFTPIYTVFCILVFWRMRLYNSLWRFASFSELMRILVATVITGVFHTIMITALYARMPISYYLIGMVLQLMGVLVVRFSYRFVLLLRSSRSMNRITAEPANVMLIGAGSAGQLILHDIITSEELNEKVCCVIDDNPNKWHRFIDGVEIVGGREDILANVEKYHIHKIYIAIPSASPEDKRDIISICKETDCEIKNLPGMYQFVSGQVSVKNMKDVAIEDLLGRDVIRQDLTAVDEFLRGKVVMVTGGGGSIGSELCRQIARREPKALIIFDVYENNAYAIQQELKRKAPGLNLITLIGSVRDSKRVNSIFEKYKPQVVYHAAAHKHVPLMEDSPCETIKNNVLGTYKVAYAAMHNDCERFVLISTDKAVNPTNIMGASKRLCEMIIQTFDYMVKHHKENKLPLLHAHMEDEGMESGEPITSHTKFTAVRFGNVLGSNGSVIPLFRKQIEEGGPVTVTHPDIIRYFMTIPEAVSLVLQASVMGEGSEIFVLDMGSPVKIADLARNLIKLSGYKPDVDIKIEYTGLRPGEKLYEEKLMAEEGLERTENHLIHIGKPISFDRDHFINELKVLMDASYNEEDDRIRGLVEEVVVTYHPVEL